MKNNLNIIIERDKYGYYAYSPELKGCQSQGDTFEEAMANIKEAIELYIETLSSDELAEILDKEIYTTNIEVPVA
jgi:predicted RNase H-like HicB family nuclease